MAPMILEMEVHCLGCARKIRKAVKKSHGVEAVWASPETGLVVVNGPVDAAALRSRIQSKMRRAVTIVSDGAAVSDRAAPAEERHPPHPPPPAPAPLPLGYPQWFYAGTTSSHLAPPPPPHQHHHNSGRTPPAPAPAALACRPHGGDWRGNPRTIGWTRPPSCACHCHCVPNDDDTYARHHY
ncbi:hypothetical protein ACP4OV_019406 [Aristida adscensionis]